MNRLNTDESIIHQPSIAVGFNGTKKHPIVVSTHFESASFFNTDEAKARRVDALSPLTEVNGNK